MPHRYLFLSYPLNQAFKTTFLPLTTRQITPNKRQNSAVPIKKLQQTENFKYFSNPYIISPLFARERTFHPSIFSSDVTSSSRVLMKAILE